MFDKKEISI
ncbi:hypothetical protein OCT59_005070 [Rhizophagus irregularis]|nr:hypothetical protein OCT59_005070 [Rhizophagus irregularis]